MRDFLEVNLARARVPLGCDDEGEEEGGEEDDNEYILSWLNSSLLAVCFASN